MNYRRAERLSKALSAAAEEHLPHRSGDRAEFNALLKHWDGVLAQMRYRNEQHHARLRQRDDARWMPGRP